MKLVELRIRNFRALGGDQNTLRFEDSNIIFLIGQNNVGKSSFLHAFEFFVNPKQKAVASDFFKYDANVPIEIEADFRKEVGDEENPDFIKNRSGSTSGFKQIRAWSLSKKYWEEVDKTFIKSTKNPDGEFVANGFGGIDSLFTKYAPTPIAINAIETIETFEKKSMR